MVKVGGLCFCCFLMNSDVMCSTWNIFEGILMQHSLIIFLLMFGVSLYGNDSVSLNNVSTHQLNQSSSGNDDFADDDSDEADEDIIIMGEDDDAEEVNN